MHVGYDLHITRADELLDSEEHPIGRDEWNDYARQHPGLVEAGWVQWKSIGRETVYELAGRNGESPSLSWYRGVVDVSGPEMDYLPDLVAIAADLHANVIGDEGEHYTAEGPAGSR
jgi:hypothetical protein